MVLVAALIAALTAPTAGCGRAEARATITSDLHPQGEVVRLGPLTLGFDRPRRGGVTAPEATVVLRGRRAVTLTVAASARRRFSLLFAGASSGHATGPRWRIADGLDTVRFVPCRRGPTTFLGGVLIRGRDFRKFSPPAALRASSPSLGSDGTHGSRPAGTWGRRVGRLSFTRSGRGDTRRPRPGRGREPRPWRRCG